MLMDIACPAELTKVEQAQFGDGRRQAYLTFLHETDRPITAVSGRMTLRSETGHVLEHRQVAFDNLSAQPQRPFTCHLALDGYPVFETAEISLEYVAFEEGEPWFLHPRRLMDCTPPPLAPGPERVALVALAGHDAICFPERRDSLWICVCGRYNRWRWPTCRRCSRVRDEVFELYTPERVVRDYQDAVEAIRVKDQERLIQRVEKEQEQKVKVAARKERRNLIFRREQRIIAVATAVLALSLLVWGALKLFGSSTDNLPSEATPLPPVDYLETL